MHSKLNDYSFLEFTTRSEARKLQMMLGGSKSLERLHSSISEAEQGSNTYIPMWSAVAGAVWAAYGGTEAMTNASLSSLYDRYKYTLLNVKWQAITTLTADDGKTFAYKDGATDGKTLNSICSVLTKEQALQLKRLAKTCLYASSGHGKFSAKAALSQVQALQWESVAKLMLEGQTATEALRSCNEVLNPSVAVASEYDQALAYFGFTSTPIERELQKAYVKAIRPHHPDLWRNAPRSEQVEHERLYGEAGNHNNVIRKKLKFDA